MNPPPDPDPLPLPHARERLDAWSAAWATAGRLVLLLDFDGTLAPIVDRQDQASLPPATRAALERLLARGEVDAALVSGRALDDLRGRAALPGIAAVGNHGLEVEVDGARRVHPGAISARPVLQRAAEELREALRGVPGAQIEDKGLTLTVHFRRCERERVPEVRSAVRAAADGRAGLRLTAGKEVLEVRPRVDWHKGRAVEALLRALRPPPGAPVLYLGDDVTDEDAFRAVARRPGGEGIVVADPPPVATAARCRVADPAEVAELLEALAGWA